MVKFCFDFFRERSIASCLRWPHTYPISSLFFSGRKLRSQCVMIKDLEKNWFVPALWYAEAGTRQINGNYINYNKIAFSILSLPCLRFGANICNFKSGQCGDGRCVVTSLASLTQFQ